MLYSEPTNEDVVVQATIGLADPDPGAKRLPKSKRQPITGENNVTFKPKQDEIAEKDEL